MKRLILLVIALLSFSDAFCQPIMVGSGSSLSVFSPICRSRDYSVYEIIYLSTDIGMSGTINSIGFQRSDGENTDPIDSVSIFCKHTALTSLGNSTFIDTGYTLVYAGAFPNDSGAGWRTVPLQTPFSYNQLSNLMVLVVKGYQPAVANTPIATRWLYTNTSPDPDRARRYYGNDPVTDSTVLTSTNFSSNILLDFGTLGVKEIGQKQLHIYPNPATNFLHVEIALSMTAEIGLFNAMGEEVLPRNSYSFVDSGVQDIDISGLPSGIYTVEVKSGAEIYRRQVIIASR